MRVFIVESTILDNGTFTDSDIRVFADAKKAEAHFRTLADAWQKEAEEMGDIIEREDPVMGGTFASFLAYQDGRIAEGCSMITLTAEEIED